MNRFAHIALLGVVSARLLAAETTIVISEFQAINSSTHTDEDGEYSDWIEIYNTASTNVSLDGWSLTDADGLPRKWSFPTIDMPPGRFLVVFASGKNRHVAGEELHTNFKLTGDGEYLALTAPDGTAAAHAFAPAFPEQYADMSYGLTWPPDSGEQRYFATPTPGTTNANAFIGIVEDTRFSVDRGYFYDPFEVVITSKTADATIRYTLNGTAPTIGTGTIYSNAIPLTNTTILRAAAFKPSYLATDVDTHTYVFPEQVVRQPAWPEGFPTVWKGQGNTTANADYEMDPDIVNHQLYSNKMVAALCALPVMSLVTDTNHLFDPQTGFYSNPKKEGVAWERPTSAELFHPGGKSCFQVDCGLRVYGGSSRHTDFPKKTLRLLFKGQYGVAKLRYPLFGDDPFGEDAVEEFDTIVLRGGHNNTWIHRHWFQAYRSQYIRDQWVRDSQIVMGSPSCHGTYTHLYINGLYWGIYNITERPSAPFLASYYGGEKEDYDAQNVNLAIDGDVSMSGWIWLRDKANAGLAANADYEAVAERLDIDQFTDYMLLNFYVGNDDWDGHNWYAGRRRTPPGPYRVFSWDAELCISRHVTSAPPPQPEYDIVLNRNRTTLSVNNKPSRLFTRLRANAEYRLRCADRIHKHMFNSGALTPPEIVRRWLARHNQVYAALPAESARWGDYKRDVDSGKYTPDDYDLFHPEEHYLAHQEWLLNGYFQWRHDIVLNQLRAINCYPDVDAPVLTPFGGLYTNTLQLAVTAQNPVYYTLDGSDPREYGTGNPVGDLYSAPVPMTRATHVKARARNGSTWSALTEAVFTPATLPPLQVTEIMYNPLSPTGAAETNKGFRASDFEFIELRNTGATSVGLAGVRFTDGILFDFTDGPVPVLEPDELVVVVKNLQAFTNRYTDWQNMNIAGEFRFPMAALDDDGEDLLLVDGEGRAILDFDYEDDWYPNTDGSGFSLVPASPTNDLGKKGAWRPSAFVHGSPGRPDTAADAYPPHGTVIINEALTHQDHGPEGTGDWIELKNVSTGTVDIGGWFLSDRSSAPDKYQVPTNTVLQPGEFAVFTEHNHFGTNAPGMGTGGFALSELGDNVVLSSGTNGVLTGYRTEQEFDAAERNVTFGRYTRSDGEVHFPALTTPSPGTNNSMPRVGPVVIGEIMYHPEGAQHEFIEIHNTAPTNVPLFDPANPTNMWTISGAVSFTFATGTVLSAGERMLVIPVSRTDFVAAYPDLSPAMRTFGPFDGKLDNAGETLRLNKPGEPEPLSGEVPVIPVEKVKYDDRPPWPAAADGLGASLERADPGAYADDPANWIPGPGCGSPGTERSKIVVSRPSDGAAWFVPASITVEAGVDGSQVDGAVDRVDIHAGTGHLASCTASPYAAALAATTTGTISLCASIHDNGGATTSRTATVSLLSLNDLSPGSVSDRDALLRGVLSGPAGASVHVCWGSADGGTNDVDNWEHAIPLGRLTNDTFAVPVELPASHQGLVYRFRAATDHDQTWTAAATVSTQPYAAWPQHMRVTFAGYAGARPLTNFPALVRLGSHIAGFDYSTFASPMGADLRFTDKSGAAQLSHEIDTWDTNGTSAVWVRLPGLSGTNTIIRAYWGNPAATTPPPCAVDGSVWSGDFKTVWHAGADNTEAVTHQHALMDYGSTVGEGKVGPGRLLDGVDNYLDLIYVGEPWYWLNLSNATVSAWARPDARENMIFFGMQANGHTIAMGARPVNRYFRWSLQIDGREDTTPPAEIGAWTHVVLQLSNGTARTFCDGSDTATIGPYETFVPGNRCFVGAINADGVATRQFGGAIDELRLSTVARSSDWIAAEHATVADHGNFTTYEIVPVYADTDRDGMGDKWEVHHFGSTNAPAGGPAEDHDGDGSPNADEFIAGTDPTNAASAFTLHIARLPDGVTVRFWTADSDEHTGTRDRLYSLQRAETLTGDAWAEVTNYTDIVGHGAFVTYTNNPLPESTTLYRARARLSPPYPP